MSDNINTIIGEIDYKIRKLIHQNELFKTENELHKTEINQLKSIIETQKNEIENYNQKIKIIKLSKTIENKRDLTKTKLKINELVREIDTCISLLNK
jgi:hypothetical protein